jgi:molecular chaperone DnaK
MVGFGIDFGTTNSVASAFDGRELTTFVDNNNLPHPSVLWYRGEGRPAVGREAKDRIKDFGNTPGNQFIRSIKSRIQQETEFEIFGKYYYTYQIAGEIFRFLREDAHDRYPVYPKINEAVVTIPLYFNGQQRKAIRKAAEVAGIFIKNFIHEPFAAVIGYLFSSLDSLDQLKTIKENILVFDWGGGTLDITLVKLDSGTVSEISNQGYPGRSGDHFDEILVTDVLDKFRQEHDISSRGFRIDAGAESILAHDIEFAKIDLSERESASVKIPDFYSFNDKSIPLRSEVSRRHFESLINLDIQDAMGLVDKVLYEARLQTSQVGLVLLIGGTSKIPLLDKMMRDTFGTAKVRRIANADTVISEGAAIISYYDWQPYLVNPICIQMSDESHYQVFDSGTILNPETAQKEIKFFCTDNRDGEGILILSDKLIGNRYQVKDPIIKIPITNKLLNVYKEKIVTDFRVDNNLILRVSAKGSIKDQPVYSEYHDLCYGLRFA